MSYKYINASSGLLKHIIASEAAAAKKQALAASLERFISAFYYLVPEEDVTEYSADDLKIIAANIFGFIQDYDGKTPKLRVFNPSKEEQGWQSACTVLEIVNTDKPFLVDSVSEELTRQGFRIHKIFHPVLEVARDEKGGLKEVKEVHGEKGRAGIESVMHFQVSHTSDEKRLAELEAGVERVLESVSLAVVDWRALVDQLNVVVPQFSLAVRAYEAYLKGAECERLRSYANETLDFLEWLKEDNFVFLGYEEYDRQESEKKNGPLLAPVKGTELGLFKQKELGLAWDDLPVKNHKHVKIDEIVEITKSSSKCPVHRHVHMDCISIQKFDEKGNRLGEYRFLGLFTSQVYFQTAKAIPLIRKKIDYVQAHSGFKRSSHNAKALVAVLESFPRDELFQMSQVELFESSIEIVALAVRQNVRLFVRKDDLERFVSCIVYIPRERMSTGLRKKMEDVLTEAFQGTVSNHYTQITESHLARLQIIIKTKPGAVPHYSVKKIEDKLVDVATSWEEKLENVLKKRVGERRGDELFAKYANAFSVSYATRFTPEDAYFDIKQIEAVSENGQTVFDLYESVNVEPDLFQLKLFHPEKQIGLSDIMPVLENTGVRVLAEHTYVVRPAGGAPVWIHHFRFAHGAEKRPKLSDIKKKFQELLSRVWMGHIHSDGFNRLVMCAHLDWRQIVLLRAYGRYLQQLGFRYSQHYIHDVLSRHPKVVTSIVELYYAKFDTSIAEKKRSEWLSRLKGTVEKQLSSVTNLAEDKVLRSFVDLIEATLRTNYFQSHRSSLDEPVISFKFECAKVPGMPLPRPYAEIFVYSPRVEAVHLRGGKVARGGLRWSDRPEDFRTEVLGLMKAQMTKNTVIVPVGSKGGFVVKKPPVEGGREAMMQEAVACYKTFLRGMLDITDNIVDGKIVRPKEVVRYDEDDPYLVVAPDKGTATFSDFANEVSEEYGFWLGDAFASGGSVGYDHKKMGITARGAWISVETHFAAMGIDVAKEDHTAIGIGDMAGDVFGNGMLCSKHTRLVAAFNHLHIFIDPNPDTAAAYKERKRLFELPRSSWTDFNAKLISQGGGIFERAAKSIKISREMKQVFNIEKDSLTPDELIRALLKAPIDLLWNGGIGTYVKATIESNDEVGDRANDALRINGCELGAKVVGEGGNLGMTQRGRIEYASCGGRINTDSIDNSAGVDCSDHEVNIKILLYQAIRNKHLAQKDRNKVLADMTDEVGALVLRDNRLQNQALTITELQGSSLLEVQAKFMTRLEKQGRLARAIEFLPTDQEIGRLHAEGKGLSRPELSVILAYSKLTLYEELLQSNLPDDAYYSNDLMLYFPKEMQARFRQEIEQHQLRREIIATFVTNSMVNRVGSTFFFHVSEETGMSAEHIARAYTITRDIFDLRTLWKEVEGLQGRVSVEHQVELFKTIQNLVERTAIWFLTHLPQPLDVGKVVEEYKEGVQTLSSCMTGMLSPVEMEEYTSYYTLLKSYKVPEALAKTIAGLNTLASACDIVRVARTSNLPVDKVGRIYSEVGARLGLDWLRAVVASLPANSYWKRLSNKTLVNSVFDEQVRLAREVIKFKGKDKEERNLVEAWASKYEEQMERFDGFMRDLRSQEAPDLPMLVVATKKIEEICIA